MTPNLSNLHAYLRTDPGRTAAQIWFDISVCRRLGSKLAGLPATLEELETALAELERAGLLEKREREWFWVAEKSKVEARLFA